MVLVIQWIMDVYHHLGGLSTNCWSWPGKKAEQEIKLRYLSEGKREGYRMMGQKGGFSSLLLNNY